MPARIQAFAQDRGLSRRLRGELESLRERDDELIAALREWREQLRRAGLLQRDLFRCPIPSMRGAQLRVLSYPMDSVSGDVHRVQRLTETHVAISLADATGHDFSAALLAVAVQRLLGETSAISSSRPTDPEHVFARLNRELLDTDIQECHYVTAVYANYDEATQELTLARAGAPYPILLRPGKPARHVACEGLALGVLRDAIHRAVTIRLEPGDVLIFHTDGLDDWLDGTDPADGDEEQAPSPTLRFWNRNPAESLAEIEEGLRAASDDGMLPDDVTLVALEVQ
jgi:sigma-B regulation protein RsbU (phosphoserine phosphatase)